MDNSWLDSGGSLLGPCSPIPLDRPFTAAQAEAWGVSRRALPGLVAKGLVRVVLRGVYAAAQAPDDVMLRATALALVLPPTAVVVDRTAAWLHGVEILPRTAVSTPPPVNVAHVTDTRVRRPETDGRRRGLTASDMTVVAGVPVTTALRTALDLGRLLWRYDALAAIDGFLGIGVPHDLLAAEIGRFRGYRGVRQLRMLVPLGDGRAESPGESALRLHWYDAGLPRPTLQHWVYDDGGEPIFRLDITDPEVRYAAEYDGAEFHSGDDEREHDATRRSWLREARAWHVDAFDKGHVYGSSSGALDRLTAGHRLARRTVSLWTPRRRPA